VRRSAIAIAAVAALLLPSAAGAQTPPTGPRLSFAFPDGNPKLVVAYGKAATATGKLVDAAGAPIAGAPVALTVHESRDTAVDTDGGTVTTGADGTFTVPVPAGPSRRVTAGYRPSPAEPPVTASIVLAVRAGVLLHATPRELHTGQRLRLSGTLQGGPFPAAGKVVELQVRRGGHWLTFADVRAKNAAFSYRYRFSKVKTVRRLRFRALVPAFGTYPYARGASRSVGVTIRGRAST
jgi:hypothetical protein